MREWKQLQRVLAGLGLVWADVWRLTIDRRAGTVVVVAADGRKFAAQLGGEPEQGSRGERESGPSPQPSPRGRGSADAPSFG